MPCYDPPISYEEKYYTEVICLMEQINGILIKDNKYYNQTYLPHPKLNHFTKKQKDEHIARLCSYCQDVNNKQSLELQKWWIEHQILDRNRLLKELEDSKDKDLFMSTLNDYEKNLI